MEARYENFMKVMMSNIIILFFGQSGSGKGVHAGKIVALYEWIRNWYPGGADMESMYIETGAEFRREIPNFSSDVQKRLAEIQDSGRLQSHVPASILWGNQILYNYKTGPIVFDGSPRSVDEAIAIVKFIKRDLKRTIIPIHFSVPDDECERRMVLRNDLLIKEGKQPRSDTDTPEDRKRKLSYYHEDVIPALEYIQPHALPVIEIEPIGPISETHGLLVDGIADRLRFLTP